MADLEDRLNEVLIAAKTFKLEVEKACRLLMIDVLEAERVLVRALQKAEKDGL